MQISENKHYEHPWISHDLLKDFYLEDVWQFPVQLNEKHDIQLFQTEMMEGLGELKEKGLPGFLFKIRFFIGRIFDWDEKGKAHPPMERGSIRERYAQAFNLKTQDLQDPGSDDFVPVYLTENESLAEIKNATVHAGLHLGKVPQKNGNYTVQMAVYVKPNGFLGKVYMALIKPFRHTIVYPVLMRNTGKRWEKFLANES